MGSLVPGWDANIGVPRDLMPDTDIDKEPQPEGYFARLRSHRHGAGELGDEAAAFPLGRTSAPQSLTRSYTKQAPVPRSSTLTQPGPLGSGAVAHKYQFTDWSEELSTLRKSSLGRSSLSAHEEGHTHGSEGGAAWWRALEVAQLNEHPDAAQNSHDAGHSTFVPQFTQSKKLDFGEASESM